MYAPRFLLAFAAALVAACFLTGCGTQPRSVKAASSVKPDKERHPAPEFALKDQDRGCRLAMDSASPPGGRCPGLRRG